MSEQPEALWLADRLEGRYALHPEVQQAAAELRRLHAEVNELKRTLALQQQSYEREIQIEVEAEREECARVCQSVIEEIRETADNVLSHEDYRSIQAVQDCITVIRARGKA